MARSARRGRRSRGRVLLVLFVAIPVLVGGGLILHQARRQSAIAKALARGREAFAQQDWPTARAQLARYISAHPGDVAALELYAQASLAKRPLAVQDLRQAIWAYQQIRRAAPAHGEAFGRLVLLYEATGNYGELEYLARQQLGATPEDPAAALALAKALLARERAREAERVLRELVGRREGRGPAEQHVEACGLLARLRLDRGEQDALGEAAEWLDLAVRENPESALAYTQRAVFRREFQRGVSGTSAADCRADLGQAESLPIANPRVHLLLAQQWIALGEAERAAAQVRAAQAAPESAVAAYVINPEEWAAGLLEQAGRLMILKSDFQAGAELARAAAGRISQPNVRLKTLPLIIELLALAGEAEAGRRYLAEYVDILKMRGATGAYEARIGDLTALIARADGQPNKVIEMLEPLVHAPGAPAARVALLAEAYAQTGQAERAAALLAFANMPVAPGTGLTAAGDQPDRGEDLGKALQLARRAAELNPADPRAHSRLGDLLYQTGDLVGAEQSYRAALGREPDHADSLNNLAWVLAEQGRDLDEALELSRRAVAARPAEANFHETLGFVLHQRPDGLTAARDAFRRAAELAAARSSMRARALFRLARVCGELGEPPPISGCVQEALAIDRADSVFSAAERRVLEQMLSGGGGVE